MKDLNSRSQSLITNNLDIGSFYKIIYLNCGEILFNFVACNVCQSSPSLTILVPSWCFSIFAKYYFQVFLISTNSKRFLLYSSTSQDPSRMELYITNDWQTLFLQLICLFAEHLTCCLCNC